MARFPLVALVAAGMGWFGLALMYAGSPYVPLFGEFWTNYVIVASIILWCSAAFFLRGRSVSTWLWFGALSPLLGASLAAPPAGFVFILAKGYVAFPVGLATAWLVYRIDRRMFGRRQTDTSTPEVSAANSDRSDPAPHPQLAFAPI
ncbi:MAG TPA: hypothetical protein DCQ98_21945 [Planctomycetaceae bacterium]|nr:hypothetical protein [Planctomycetaceae bacterium]